MTKWVNQMISLTYRAVRMHVDLQLIEETFECENTSPELLKLEPWVIRWIGDTCSRSVAMMLRSFLDNSQHDSISLVGLLYYLKNNLEHVAIFNAMPAYKTEDDETKKELEAQYLENFDGDTSDEGKRKKLDAILQALPTKGPVNDYIQRVIAHPKDDVSRLNATYGQLIEAAKLTINQTMQLNNLICYNPIKLPEVSGQNKFIMLNGGKICL